MSSKFPSESTGSIGWTASLSQFTSSPLSTSLLFIDAGVSGASQIAAAAQPGTEVHLLFSQTDAIAQITQVLSGRSGIESLQIVSHGGNGRLDFVSGALNLASLPSQINQLKSWGAALTVDADILLYGCDVAQDYFGQSFVNLLAQTTGADVAASKDLTGFGGDWDLEFQTGRIEATALSAIDYAGTLGNFTVSNTTVGNASVVNSIDWALAEAEKDVEADTITFDFANNATLTFTEGFTLRSGSNITFTRKAGSTSTITLEAVQTGFSIDTRATAAFQGLTLTSRGTEPTNILVNRGLVTELSDMTFKQTGEGWNFVNYGTVNLIDNSSFTSSSTLNFYSANHLKLVRDTHFSLNAVSSVADQFGLNLYLEGTVGLIMGSSIVSTVGFGISGGATIQEIVNSTISNQNGIAINHRGRDTIGGIYNSTIVSQDEKLIDDPSTITNLYNTAILKSTGTGTTALTGVANQENNYNGTLSNSGLAVTLTQVAGKKTFAHAITNNANATANLIDQGDNRKVSASITTDQAGRVRVSGSYVDIGALELQSSSLEKRQAIVRNETTGEVAMYYYEGLKLVEIKSIYNGSVSPSNLIVGVTKNWQLKAVHDFNNDGNADALWQNTDGSTFIWEMKDNIATVKSLFYSPNGARQELNAIGPWNIVGLGSESATPTPNDRQLLLQNKDSGELYTWKLNGYEVMLNGSGSIQNNQGVIVQAGSVWKALHRGDFNGDGFANDVLFQNQFTGSLAYWATQNNFITEMKELGILPLNGALSLIATGRYTPGVRNTELLLHDRITGELIVDQLSNLKLGEVTTKWLGASAPMGNPTAFNDLNADGKVEAFWANASGKLTISTLDANAQTSTTVSDSITGLGVPLPGWQVIGVGQFVKPDNLPLVQPSFNLTQSTLETRANRTIAKQIIQDFYPGAGEGNQTLTGYTVTVVSGGNLIKTGTTPTIDNAGKLTLETTSTANATGTIQLAIVARDSGATNNTSTAKTLTIVLNPTSTVSKEVIVRNEATGDVEIQYFNGVERIDRKSIYLGSVSDANKISGLTKDWQLKATYDFTGDGRTDLLWQNTNGKLVLWEMNDNLVTQASDLFYRDFRNNIIKLSDIGDWQVIGMGTSKMPLVRPLVFDPNNPNPSPSFTIDPSVILQNRVTGEMAMWLLRSGKEVQASLFNLTYQRSIAKPGKDWKAIQITDFDGDGASDVILQNQVSGELYSWVLNFSEITQSVSMGTLAPSNAWSIVNTARNVLNNNDNSLVFHNRITGETVIGKLENGQVVKTLSSSLMTSPLFGKPMVFGKLDTFSRSEVLFANSAGKMTIGDFGDWKILDDVETNLGDVKPGWTPVAIVDTQL